MMRKFLIGTTLTSLLGALVIGGALAWTATAGGGAGLGGNMGSISASLANIAGTGNALYPGATVAVATGNVQNTTPANPGVAIAAQSGTVSGLSTSDFTCNTWLALPGAWGGSVAFGNQNAIPVGGIGDPWTASISLNTGAPNDCMGKSISYNVDITVTT